MAKIEAHLATNNPVCLSSAQPGLHEQVLLHAARHAACTVEAPYARIWLAEADGSLVCAAAHGYVHERTYERRLSAESVAGLTVRTGLLHLRDAPAHPRWAVSRDFGARTGLGAYLGVALTGGQGPLGALELMRATGEEFELREISRVQSLVEVVGRAIDTARYGARMHLALEQARQSSRESSVAHARVLAVARHELRGYLARLKLQVELLSGPDAETHPPLAFGMSLGRVERTIDGLTDLVDDLLRIADDDGLVALMPGRTDLGALTRQVANDFTPSLVATGRLRLELPEAPCMVYGEPIGLERLVINLLDNAFKYSPDGGPIRVVVELDGAGASVRVSDRGMGFPSDADAQFEPFARGSNAVQRGIPGSGLGLYVCRELAERYGGRTWVDPPGANGWTTVSVWLPSPSVHP